MLLSGLIIKLVLSAAPDPGVTGGWGPELHGVQESSRCREVLPGAVFCRAGFSHLQEPPLCYSPGILAAGA